MTIWAHPVGEQRVKDDFVQPSRAYRPTSHLRFCCIPSAFMPHKFSGACIKRPRSDKARLRARTELSDYSPPVQVPTVMGGLNRSSPYSGRPLPKQQQHPAATS
jgi:hypothetical protein